MLENKNSAEMTALEFYENYWKIDGVRSPVLSEADRDFLEAIEKVKNGEYLGVIRVKKRRTLEPIDFYVRSYYEELLKSL